MFTSGCFDMNRPAATTRWTTMGFISLLLALTSVQHLPVSFGSTSSTETVSLPQTSDVASCFQNINRAIAQLPPISSDRVTQLIKVAESSAQYETFAGATGGLPSLVGSTPTLEYHTLPGCAGITIEAYTFSFISGGKELSIGVDPAATSIRGSLIVPAVSWGVQYNNTGGAPWGGGYGYWNGSSITTPSYPWYYIEGDWTIPTISSTCSSPGCTYGIWSGLGNNWYGSYMAQTGFGATADSNNNRVYWTWYQFYPTMSSPHNCYSTVNVGDSLHSATYSNAWASSSGSPSYYNVDTYDSNTGYGCSTYSYSWSSGLGSSSYFAFPMGELQQATTVSFSPVTITGTIYDNHYNGGPSGHCTSTPYNQNYAESFYYSYGGHILTESLDNGHCQFNDDRW